MIRPALIDGRGVQVVSDDRQSPACDRIGARRMRLSSLAGLCGVLVGTCWGTGCSTLRGGQPGRSDPAVRLNIVMAANLVYSPIHRKVLMVNGAADLKTQEVTRVWSWDGHQWSPHDGDGPAVRLLGTAAYDVARKQLVLFGGLGPGAPLDDMWAWNGTSWHRVKDAAVGPRDHHVMSYDRKRGRVVLFGGSGARPPGSERRLSPSDTWEWDGEEWAQVAPTGPSSRGRSAMVYDEKRGEMVLFGGGGDEVLGDTWLWNGERWRLASTTGPAPRYAHAMAYDSHRDVVVLFGGSTFKPAQYLQFVFDTWEWDGRRWTPEKSVAP
jgi:hypothetical protein